MSTDALEKLQEVFDAYQKKMKIATKELNKLSKKQTMMGITPAGPILDEINTIKLVNYVSTNSGVWDPWHHPRNKDGEFVRKGTGSFMFGLTKKAFFAKGGGAVGTYVTQPPPNFKGGIHYTLNPGDTAYGSTHGNAYVKHADGSWTNYLPGQADNAPKSQSFPAGGGAADFFQKKVDKGDFKQIEHQPGIEIAANNLAQAEKATSTKIAVGDTVDMAQLGIMPIGSVVNAGSIEGIEKKDDGWHLPETGAIIKVWKTDIQATVTKLGTKEMPDDWESDGDGVEQPLDPNMATQPKPVEPSPTFNKVSKDLEAGKNKDEIFGKVISEIKTEVDKVDAEQSKLPPVGETLTKKQWDAAPDGTLADAFGLDLLKKDGKWTYLKTGNGVSFEPGITVKGKAPKPVEKKPDKDGTPLVPEAKKSKNTNQYGFPKDYAGLVSFLTNAPEGTRLVTEGLPAVPGSKPGDYDIIKKGDKWGYPDGSFDQDSKAWAKMMVEWPQASLDALNPKEPKEEKKAPTPEEKAEKSDEDNVLEALGVDVAKIVGKSEEEIASNKAKKNKLTAQDPNDAPSLEEEFTNPEGEPWLDNAKGAYAYVGNKKGFWHPVSGEHFALKKGDHLLQHKLTPTSFAVLGPDGEKKFQVNKNGKKYKWSPHIPKSNYKVVHTAEEDSWDQPIPEKVPDGTQFIKGADFIHPVSGKTAHIEEGETLMQHNFTPNSYLVLNPDGSMKYKIDVKGNIEKAGTNLKPSNYHSIMTGPAPKVPKGYSFNESKFHLLSSDEVQAFLDDEMEEGDYLTTADNVWTKQENGMFTDDVGGVTTSSKAIKSVVKVDPPEGTKSLHDVPLNKEELTHWLSKQENGSSITSGENFSAKKVGTVWDVKYNDSHWSTMYFSTLATVVKTFDKSTMLNMKHEDPPPPPKAVKTEVGIPAYGSTDEIVDYLYGLSPGTKIHSPKFGWEATKQEENSWKVNNNDTWATGFFAGLMTTWGDALKDDLQVEAGAPKLNSKGVPASDEKALTKWLKDLPVGTVVGIDTAPASSSGKPPSATKIAADEWNDDGTGKTAASSLLAKSIVANKNGKADEFGVKELPKTPSGEQAKKKATKKAQLPSNIAGKPTIEIDSETLFASHFKNGVAKELNFALTGVDSTVNSWYQQDFLHYVDGYDHESKMKALARPELGEATSNAIATLEWAKKNGGLAPGTKTKATKMVKKLQELHKIHKAAVKMQNGELPEEHPIDDKFVWGNKQTWTFDMSYVKQTMNKAYNEVKFKTESADLGWDPFTGTHQQYKDYLVNNTPDGEWGVYLGESHAQKLALHHMKAPGYTLMPYQTNDMKKSASKGQFAAQVSDLMKQKNGQAFKPAFITMDKEFPDEPDFLATDEWNNIKGLLSGEIKVDFPETSIASEGNLQERYGHLAGIIPPEAAKALGGYFVNIDGSTARFQKTIQYLLKSGIWNEDAATYDDPQFGKVALTPGMKVMKKSGSSYFIPKDFKGGYVPYIDYNGELSRTYVYSGDMEGYEEVYAAPYIVTLKDSQTDGRNFFATDWKTLEQEEDTQAPFDSFSGSQLVEIKKSLGPDSPIKVSELSDKAKTLISLYPSYADIIVYKDQKGHYRTDEAQPEDGPKTEWEATLAKDDVPEFLKNGIGKEEDPDEIGILLSDLYNDDLNFLYTWLTGNQWEESENYDYIANELRDLITAQQANTLAKDAGETDVAKFGTMHKLPNQNLGGMRPKVYYANQDGEMYMGKPDNAEKFRVDTEYAVVEIAKSYGYNVPDADIRVIDGDYTYLQYVAPADRNFYGITPDELDDKQLIDVMSGHALDWAISQHDSHGGQILMQPNGKVLKIDLGQAYKFLGSDKLAVGYIPPGNPEPVWYDKFYEQVQAGNITQERLDKVTKSVLTKARRIATTKDALFQQSLELAFSRRKYWPKGYDRESYTQLAMDRKHETFGDFFDFYQKLYKSGGYDFGFTQDEFEQTTLAGSKAHLAPTAELAEHVKFTKAHGTPLFFASSEIEDAHALLFTSQTSAGKETMHADLKIRTDGDAEIKAWVSAQGVTISLPDDTEPKTMEPSAGFDSATINAAGSLVKFAKTVSVHQEDGKYNQETIAEITSAKETVQIKLTAINTGLENNPLYRHPSFETGHQQYAWREWAEKFIASVDSVDAAMKNSQKSPMVDASVTYAPPKGVEVTKDIKAIETVELNGATFTKHNDHTYTVSTPEAQTIQTSAGTYENAKGSKGAVTKLVTAEEKGESKQVVASPKYTVKETVFKTPKYHPIEKDGTIVEKGTQNWTPKGYDITSSEHPDIKINYFPHQKTGADNSNQGRLQITIKDWQGDHADMDRAFGMLNDMGVDTSPADETSLELFYWRHLAGILRQRKLDAQAKKTKVAMDALEAKLEQMSADEEIEARKKVFAGLWGQEVVDNAEWRPQIGDIAKHMKPSDADDEFDVSAGRPHWNRPDFNIADVREWSKGILPHRTDSYGTDYLLNGAYTSNEEKIRYLGQFGDSVDSNSPTSDRQQGSGQFGFLRQKQYMSYSNGIYLEPWILARTSNYAFNSDEYGNVETRNKKSPFDLKGSINMGDGDSSNELMFKYGFSIWDDVAIIQVSSLSAKDALVAQFKAKGITFIRGIAIEERIVTSKDEAKKVMAKIWAQAEKDQADG